MRHILHRLRTAAPLLICVGIIFPWAVSPFGILSCSPKTGSFVPESRSILRQWLPLKVQLDTTADQKGDPSNLGGLDEMEIYYFDPLIIGFLFAGFLLWVSFRKGGRVRIILAKCVISLIWAYLTAVLILILSSSSHHDCWLQPGFLVVLFGYLILTSSGIFDFFKWIISKLKNFDRLPKNLSG